MLTFHCILHILKLLSIGYYYDREVFGMDLPYVYILFALSFTRGSEAACGNLTYREPAIQGRNVTFVFKPDSYRNDTLPILKNDKYNIHGQRISVSADPTRSVYLIVFNTLVGGRNYAGTYFLVAHNKCSSDRVRLDLKVISGCGYLYIRTKVVTVGGYVELGYFPAFSVIHNDDLYVRQLYNATSSLDMNLSYDVLSERGDPNWEFVLTIHNVNRWMSGNYSVRCKDGKPGWEKFTQPVELNVIGKPSLHSYNHTSECEDCLVGIDGKDLGSHIYCHTTGRTVPTIYVGDSKVAVHIVSYNTYRPITYVARKDDHMKNVTCSVFNAAMATPLYTSSKLYVAVKPDIAVLNVPALKEGDPANITCTSKGGRPSSKLSLMLNNINISSIASTTTNYNENLGTYTTQIGLNSSAKRELHSMKVSCFQLTDFFATYMTETKTINCKYPPSMVLLEKPSLPSKLQDIYHLVFSCKIKDFNDNCSLIWTSSKYLHIDVNHLDSKSMLTTVNVSVTKEDFGKVLVCSAVCTSFQRNISSSSALLVPYVPVMSLSVEKVFLQEYESKTVTCSVESYPLPDILWSDEFSKPLRRCQKSATCALTIEHISIDAQMIYICEASSEFGNTSSSFVAISTVNQGKGSITEPVSGLLLPWVAVAVGFIILIAITAVIVVVLRKRFRQRETSNEQNYLNVVYCQNLTTTRNEITTENTAENPPVEGRTDEVVENENITPEIHNYDEIEMEIHTYEACKNSGETEHPYGHLECLE
ncbi:uncharacterized protein LOC128235012 isoform X2 [Mya arenaria]|uniref:uncharacterized protein LOC128235012 isoform X2 n=1 Tax=Mya arenaria TaxID=6604 RepID=UPI0022DFF639|nr:uncharacterized protein LOC128235012 isoform X2 [Mya arenaria]